MGLRTNEKRCITRDCKFYFQSDHIERCGLTGLYLPNIVFKKQECVGYNSIQSKKEEIICKISSLAKEVDYLDDLTERIGAIDRISYEEANGWRNKARVSYSPFHQIFDNHRGK